GINVGAVAGPLGCGLLAQLYGWHAGFGLAGILMLIGLATYLAGYKTLTEETPRADLSQPEAKLEARDWRLIAVILGIISLSIFQSIAYNQNTNMNLIWIDRSVDLNLFGFHVPVAWFNSIDSFVSIVTLPPLLWLWRWQSRHGGEPNEVMKISIGAWMAAIANLLLVIGCALHTRVPVIYPVAYDFLLGIAFLYYWPTMLALVSRAAPPSVKATMMGFVFFSSFIASFLVGWIGTFYERMTPLHFWLLHAGIAATGGVLALILAKPLGRFVAEEAAERTDG
ncbi:MAG TPA: MFS transporter, partial [Rhizomicrobium sp.]